uniref:M24 family metallopeptidase n=1 Tax=Ignisphaera aggregans TaxID=334771 RepID=A0A7C2ZPT0_9CREN
MVAELYTPPPEEVSVARMVVDFDSNRVELYVSPLDYHRVKEMYGDSYVDVYAVAGACGDFPSDMKCLERSSLDERLKSYIVSRRYVGVDDISLCEDVICTDVRGAIRYIRRSKAPEEIDLITKASQISEKSIESVAESIRPGVTELDIAAMVESKARELGAEGFAFSTIVAIGENTSKPHHTPTRRAFTGSEPILIDFGVRVSGYVNDVTRMLLPHGIISKEYIDLVQIVDEARAKSITSIREGVQCKDVDAVARTMLKERGLSAFFIHGLGHGVGIDVHEEPRLSPNSKDALVHGDIVTIEPGIYFYGKYGVRLEDLVLVYRE